MKNQPKIAVVLSSGGLKPISSLALFEFLEEEKIDIDLLVGCSGGSLIGSFWNAGYNFEEIIEITKRFIKGKGFTRIDYQTLLSIPNLPLGKFGLKKGLLKGDFPLKFSREIFQGRRIEELSPKMVIQTTNIQTGEGIALDEGPLAEVVYASANMYPLFPPYNLEGKYLVDGAYSAPLPILEAVKRNADIIIAMLFNEKLVQEPKHFFEGFFNMTRSFSLSMIKSQLSFAIDLHHYEIISIDVPFESPVSIGAFSRIPELIDLGRRAVEKKRDEIKSAINNFK